jgi:DNA helicase-2/ATP-dependent DNA helicase PcrA
VVFMPALMQGIFPSDRVTDNWVTNPAALPADLRGDAASIPQLGEASNSAIGEYKVRLTEQQLLAEHRLAYVGATRAKRLLVGSGHCWRAELVRSRTPSAYLRTIVDAARAQRQLLAEASPAGQHNPLVVDAVPQPWPAPLDPDALLRRQEAAAGVHRARDRFTATGDYEDPAAPLLLLDDEELVAGWDADLGQLLAEARAARSGDQVVELPASLSTTALMRLSADPEGYAAELARPMPRAPSRAARFGTRFHLWIERYFAPALATGSLGQQPLVDPDDLPDRADAGSDDELELRELGAAFAAGQFGGITPYAIEAPFAVLVNGRLIRGRIDAIYALADPPGDGGFRFRVIDWKTSRHETADPLQLAVYRLAWAEANHIPVELVDAGFYYVRTDRLVRPPGLASRAEIEELLNDSG